MQFFFRLLTSLLFLFLTASVYATPGSDLSGMLNAVHTMQANFTQTVYDNHGKAVQKSYGHMAMQRPGKFRWEITRPIPQLIIANESRLWIYDPDLEQVTIRSLKQTTGEAPALLLSHMNSALDKDYVVSQLQKKSSLQWFLLVPKNADNMFASIQMGFMKGEIKQMNLQDHLGHATSVQFQNATVNAVLPTKLFVFKAPRNVDVIDETKRR